MGLTLGVISAVSQITQPRWPSSVHWSSHGVCRSALHPPQPLTDSSAVGSPAASQGGLPAAPQLLASFLVVGATPVGSFPQSTRAGKAAVSVCTQGSSPDPFSGRALCPEAGGRFSLPSGPGPQGAGICPASLEPASCSNCLPHLGLIYLCVTSFIFPWIYHDFPRSFQLKSPTWILAVFTLLLWGFPGGSEVKASGCSAGDLGSIPGLGRSPGEGNGNPLQHSCLENPMDRGAWWSTVHGVAKSRTRLSDFTFTFTLLFISTIMDLSCSSVYIFISSFISLCFISHSLKSGFLELRFLWSSVVWHLRWIFFSFARVCRVALLPLWEVD